MVGNRLVSYGILVTWLPLACSGPAWAQQNPVLDVSGFQQNRDYFNDVSFEHIDTLSGNVILTFTDLALPGNAGRVLRFQRTYNSKAASGGGVGIAGIPLMITDSSLGLQGPYPPGIDPQEFPVLVSTADGGIQRLAWDTVGTLAVSKQFWRYDRVAQTLSMPDGVVCHYDGGPPVPGTPTLRRVTECEDQYSTFVEFSYPPNQTEITQRLGSSDTRVITYDFDGEIVQSLSYGSRMWTYGATVTPPVGPGWQYAYTGTLLTQVTTPRGGVITYEYGTASYEQQNSPNPAYTQVLTKRVTGGTLPPSCREYEYVLGMDGLSSTTTETVSSSCGGTLIKRVVYTYGAPISPDSVYDGDVAALTRRVVQGGSPGNWVDLEQEETDYTVVPVLSTSLGTLEPATRTVTRVFGAARPEYTTTYVYSSTNSGDYHQPTSITETGDAGTRTIVRTYQHLQTPYVVALPTFESVSAGGETFSKSWTYTSTGFRESQIVYGITTTFMRDDLGNVRRATKADGQFTEFSYAWGVLKDTVTPEFLVTRVINPDGTVASQTQAGRTTTFDYDDSFRVEWVDPPGASQRIDTTYDNTAGGWVKVQRGSAFIDTTVDGFGRPTQTVNSVGVRTRTAYDAEGRVVYEGQPYRDLEGAGDIGTVIAYDALGRVLSRTTPGAPAATWTYGPGTVTQWDEEGRETVRAMSAFGDPDAARLTSVVDAAGQSWAYAYDAIGQLRSVQAGDGTTRSWVYWPGTDRLQSESHPESGTTQFVYDMVGRLAQRTDARNTTFTYAYDGNDRVRTITAGTEVTQIAYEAGSDNRHSAANASTATVWHHDPATGRLQTRADMIDGMVFTTGFEYDGNDRLSAVVYPSGRRVQHDLNTEGQVTRIFDQVSPRPSSTTRSGTG